MSSHLRSTTLGMQKPNPTRILIIEDNPDDEALLLRQLKKAQLDGQIRVIADGNRALTYLTDAKYRCEDLVAIFLDLHLPAMGGVELLAAIRGADRLKHLPVIVMTSTHAQEELDKCRALGVSSYVSKPVSFSAFVKAVADTFHVRRESTTASDFLPETG
jgi:two-component system response regulator